MIEFPNATKEQNKILNKIAEQKLKEKKAEQNKFDAEKDKEEFLYLWGHFERRLQLLLEAFKNELYPKGYHGLEVLVKVTKDGSKDKIQEQFVFNDKLKLFHMTEIE